MALMMGITEIWYEPAAVWLMIGRGQQCTESTARLVARRHGNSTLSLCGPQP